MTKAERLFKKLQKYCKEIKTHLVPLPGVDDVYTLTATGNQIEFRKGVFGFA